MDIKRKVMCTSTGCIEYAPERYRKYDIDIIRVHVNFQGKEYLEGLDLDPVAFYRELETLEDPKNNLPTTAMPTREELMAVAQEYKRRGIPLSVLVCDFFHWPHQGDFKFDEDYYPDPEGMIKELKDMGTELMVSV